MLVIGKNPIFELLAKDPTEFSKIIILKKLDPDKKFKEIVKTATEHNIHVMFLNKFQFEKYFQTKNKEEGVSQGIIAFIKDYEYVPLKQVIEKNKDEKFPVVLLLDEITDPHNFGAIIRSAVCLNAKAIVIPRHNSAEVNHTVIKTSAGSVQHIDICRETNLYNSITYLKDNGYWVVGTDVNSGKNIYYVDFKMKTALVVGSEGKGMRKNITDACDILAKIPMSGKLDSLNVSVSTGIILSEILRQKLAK
ncbi:23S rRNA (guanosine(2251)-2'-O)-methyltransferase RlmB [soil metagenome]